MDEVRVMTQAGETVGRALGTGMHAVRVRAVRAGQAGAEAAIRAAHRAEQRLVEHGIAPQQLHKAVTDNAEQARGLVTKSRDKAHKRLDRNAKKARKRANRARRELADTIDPGRRHRRWPWLLGLLIAGAGAGYAVLNRRPQEVLVEEQEEPTEQAESPSGQVPAREGHHVRNGHLADRL